jgi:hypothetical protein
MRKNPPAGKRVSHHAVKIERLHPHRQDEVSFSGSFAELANGSDQHNCADASRDVCR